MIKLNQVLFLFSLFTSLALYGATSYSPAKQSAPVGNTFEEAGGVVYQGTEAPTVAQEAIAKTSDAGDVVAALPVDAGDKIYQIADGKISENVVEGWRIFNGSGCGVCHGRGAVGALGPNLGNSVTHKISKEEFIHVVTNGRPGTRMTAHSNNKRLMANLDNLYAYLMARGHGVVGPGNLIKLPFGK